MKVWSRWWTHSTKYMTVATVSVLMTMMTMMIKNPVEECNLPRRREWTTIHNLMPGVAAMTTTTTWMQITTIERINPRQIREADSPAKCRSHPTPYNPPTLPSKKKKKHLRKRKSPTRSRHRLPLQPYAKKDRRKRTPTKESIGLLPQDGLPESPPPIEITRRCPSRTTKRTILPGKNRKLRAGHSSVGPSGRGSNHCSFGKMKNSFTRLNMKRVC
mmetsp:Transcript_30879/g.64529  ORF Transcript_30879/g.64529 Transcript_30879/m.64529 type:complete len:216 (+) Transcript_30879:1340-1987(+)